jgi:cytochrome d ubiquinol oxidase subunit I
LEAHFETTEDPTGLYLFGWPDAKAETVHYGIRVPYLLSFMVHNDPMKPVPGMDQIPTDERPPVWLPFQTFHLMVGLGSLMIGISGLACWSWYRKTYGQRRWLLWAIVCMPVAAMTANQAGWITAEVGRQPWIVYPSIQNGVEMMGLRTSDGLSESVTAQQVLSSIVLFGILYALLFAVWVFVLNRKIQHGPETVEELNAYKQSHTKDHMSDAFGSTGTSRGGGMLEEGVK